MLNSRMISMLIGLGMLGACSDAGERRREAQNDNGAGMAMNAGDGNAGGADVSIDLPVLKGKFQIPAIKLDTGDVDIDGVKLYPGTRVTGVDIAGEEGGSEGSVRVRFESAATPETVRGYYLQAFKAKGIAAAAQGSGVTGQTRDGKPFAILLVQEGEGTRGTIRMGNKGV